MCARCEELQIEIAELRREMRLNLDLHQWKVVQRRFRLSPTAARLALLLYQAAGAIVPNRRIIVELLNEDTFPEAVRVHACRLRKALGADSIETEWGVGYRMTAVGRARVAALLAPRAEAA